MSDAFWTGLFGLLGLAITGFFAWLNSRKIDAVKVIAAAAQASAATAQAETAQRGRAIAAQVVGLSGKVDELHQTTQSIQAGIQTGFGALQQAATDFHDIPRG